MRRNGCNGKRVGLLDHEVVEWTDWIERYGRGELVAALRLDARTFDAVVSGSPVAMMTLAFVRMSAHFLRQGNLPPVSPLEPIRSDPVVAECDVEAS